MICITKTYDSFRTFFSSQVNFRNSDQRTLGKVPKQDISIPQTFHKKVKEENREIMKGWSFPDIDVGTSWSFMETIPSQ